MLIKLDLTMLAERWNLMTKGCMNKLLILTLATLNIAQQAIM